MDLWQIYYSITGFLDRGGEVLYFIAGAAMLLWFLIFERLIYVYFQSGKDMKKLSRGFEVHKQGDESEHIRQMLKSMFRHKLLLTLPLIKTLVMVTPMLGLFGTVYGMIEIFDVISQQGTGDARALANGISLATLPTMTGMAIAIVGLFFLRQLEASVNRRLVQFNNHLRVL